MDKELKNKIIYVNIKKKKKWVLLYITGDNSHSLVVIVDAETEGITEVDLRGKIIDYALVGENCFITIMITCIKPLESGS